MYIDLVLYWHSVSSVFVTINSITIIQQLGRRVVEILPHLLICLCEIIYFLKLNKWIVLDLGYVEGISHLDINGILLQFCEKCIIVR